MRRSFTMRLVSFRLAVCLCCLMPVTTQGAEVLVEVVEEVEEAVVVMEVAQVNQIQINENQIVSWVFGNHSSLAEAKKAMADLLRSRINLVSTACELAPEQRERLNLAGQGDIHRFSNKFAAIRRTMKTGSVPQDEWQQMWQELQPLNAEFSKGLHHPQSLFAKTLRSTLDSKQLREYEEFQKIRNRQQYESIVRATIAMIENEVPLTQAQREKVLAVVLSQELPENVNFNSQYKMIFVLYQFSKVPEEKLKPIFLDNEWKVMGAMIQQGEQYEQMLRQQGVIFD